MQMVSASRMRRAQERVLAARPYAEKTWDLIRHLAAAAQGQGVNPLLEARPVRRVIMVLIASDRGLCGGYNNSVIRTAFRYAGERGVPVSYISVGREARKAIIRAGADLVAEFDDLPAELTISQAAPIAHLLEDAFLAEEVDAGVVAYTQFTGLISQTPRVRQVLPIQPVFDPEGAATRHSAEYIYEPGAEAILGRLLPHALDVEVFACLLESAASEHAARMVAMQAATTNANDQTELLTRRYNRARQTAITNQILDIASATEALRAG